MNPNVRLGVGPGRRRAGPGPGLQARWADPGLVLAGRPGPGLSGPARPSPARCPPLPQYIMSDPAWQWCTRPEICTTMCSKHIVEAADDTTGRWFYDASIPFNAANSFHFQPIANAKGIKCPLIINCESWKDTRCSVMADGWTDIKNRTLVNFLVYCPLGTTFLKSICLSNTPKIVDVLCEIFDKIIQKVGPENVMQFITDNAKL
ncbi:hypothetical protein EJ110_NYTH33002 [Nymphaea thermarum]|nr:hypothetical protein EJ110_NYTH33002 [Nymphaea thermarum]